jgi:predicted XRE-type DNA-binding protein
MDAYRCSANRRRRQACSARRLPSPRAAIGPDGGGHPAAGPGKTRDARAQYPARISASSSAVYVLHAFQKKSSTGIKTALRDVDVVSRRLKTAREDLEERYGKNRNEPKEEVIASSGNVFADLGLPDAEERQTKVMLAVAINQLLQRRRLSQSKAGKQLGINQPKVSALLNYRLAGFSVERLMHFLTALDRDVEIVIRKKPRSRGGRILVTAA